MIKSELVEVDFATKKLSNQALFQELPIYILGARPNIIPRYTWYIHVCLSNENKCTVIILQMNCVFHDKFSYMSYLYIYQ